MEFFLLGGITGTILSYIVYRFVFPQVKEVANIIEQNVFLEVRHLEDDANAVVAKVEKEFANAGGEAKAHQALALLMKLRPEALKADIRLAIELAVRKL